MNKKTIKVWAGINKDRSLSLHSIEPKRNDKAGIWESNAPYLNSVLYNELSAYFIEMDTNQKTDIQLHLLNLVHENIIQLQIEAKDWQQAIRIAYEPMVQNHYITQNYVEQTIKHVQLTGPYIVITKHVALSHTYPEAGALSCALGITVLSTPVSFGNTDNDPVRYIFSLSAIDNKQHLAAMSELVELLNNKDFYTMLDQARYPHEVIHYLEEALHH